MAILLLFAFVSGVITVLSPCILPVLPIVLSGGIQGGRARPLGVLSGFVASFTFFTLALTAIVSVLHISADVLRWAAVAIIAVFGLVMLVPKLRERYEMLASGIARRGAAVQRPGGAAVPQPGSAVAAAAPRRAAGFWSGLLVGIGIGLVWTPCVGPIMASVISLALTQRIDGGAILITLAYTLGTSIPMLAVMWGGRTLLSRVPFLTRHTEGIQKGFGVVMILIAVVIGLGWDRRFQAAVLQAFPNYGAGLTAVENAQAVKTALKERGSTAAPGQAAAGSFTPPPDGVMGSYGPAPEIVTKGMWFNTPGSSPLTMKDLQGKVVMIDFWTYSCVNCVRTLPYLRAWWSAYKDKGLVIIGVHTPEFEFEKNPANVAQAIKDLGVAWPVVQDNGYLQWNAYSNEYWPAHYFIDAKGRVRYAHFGEGSYAESERVIQTLLKEAGYEVGGGLVSKPDYAISSQTPETYLGYERAAGLISAPSPARDKAASYTASRVPANGEWSLSGTWTVKSQYIVPDASGSLELGFNAKDVYLVISPESPGGSITVLVDGKKARDTADVKGGVLLPQEDRMYQLVGLDAPGPHVLHLDVKGSLRLFAFTFG